MLKIREDKWLEWCATFNAHTSLSELWKKLRIATGKLPRASAHPKPLQEPNRLAEHFAERSSSAQLPPEIRLHLQQVQLEREVIVGHAIEETDTTDCLFSIEEIRRARKTSKDTDPGSDACVGKTAEWMVLTRLLWKTARLHHNIFGFTKGVSAAHSLATLLGSIGQNKAIVVFLDLEKASELANAQAIVTTLSRKGIKGCLLAWITDYLLNRTARVTCQGQVSDHQRLENGTLFNILMENLCRLPKLLCYAMLCYADDLALVVKGRNQISKVQRALDLISEKCMSLGLKISIPKSKAMRIGPNEPIWIFWLEALGYVHLTLEPIARRCMSCQNS
ncbi:LINE-1 retrotransposable element ORF2-like 2 [Homarus americanus]|uniref:LINE-1 retrotransposable element ORF2-like 2 n=1 Tax=Homarus americanus TaxID=6706 RepID=A0A8J5JX54_HOMAM|nr:LINE-1 retrotransposable element ORF2-like 2 [Homarus americanus]